MKAQIDMNDQQDENQIMKTNFVGPHLENISQALVSLENDSISSSQRVQDLQKYVGKLKADIQRVMGRIEENVQFFRMMLSDKLKLITNMLSDRELRIEMTLEECYKVISDLVEIFLSIGYESEKDINNLSLKVDGLDSEVKKMSEIASHFKADRNWNKPYWFINDNRITLRDNESMGSILPKFKSGDAFQRKQFITYMTQIFVYYKVPENAWVELVTQQLVKSASNWWLRHKNKFPINWPKFTELFMEAQFDNNETDCKFDNSEIYDMTNVSYNEEQPETGLKKTVSLSNIQMENNTNGDFVKNMSFKDQIPENERDVVQCYDEISKFLENITSGYKNKDAVG